jgi:sugar/nucleoside kinase (ribokinase family)
MAITVRSMLVTVGDLLEEVLVQLPGEPPRGEVTHVRSARVRGGSAANVAAITSERGGESRFVGRVGADVLGYTLTEDLSRRGVDLVVEHAGGTGVVITIAGGGRRTSLVDRGASARMEVIDPVALEGATQLYVAASALTADPTAAAVQALLGDATERRVPVVLGALGVTDVESYGAGAFLAFLAMLRPDAVIANREEHARLGLEADAPLDGPAITILTDGERPTRVMNDRGLSQEVSVHRVDSIRDRTGVGDGFTAGYLEARRSGADPVTAVEVGHRVAALVLGALGPTTRGS